MKVTPKEILELSGDPSSKKKVQGSKDVTFSGILKEAMDTSSASSGEQTTTVPPLDGLSKIALEQTTPDQRADTVQRLNRFMDILESYQSRMEDSTSTLKQISPLVDQIEEETRKLIPVLDALPDDDGLKDIMNKLLVASTVEVIKFNRGDYLA